MESIQAQNSLEMVQNSDIRPKIEEVSFLELFRFATKRDIAFIVMGTFCSILVGGAMPILALLWGNTINHIDNSAQMVSQCLTIFIEYIIVGVAAIFAGWGMQYLWSTAGEKQANQCRRSFLQALMRQEIGWFQTQQSSQIFSKFVADSNAFQLAIGQKISHLIYIISMFLTGVIVAFINGWELTLVVLAFEPLLVFSYWIVIGNEKKRWQHEAEIFQSASGIAQEAIQSIKIVKQFNGQDHQIRKFESKSSEIGNKSFSFNMKMAAGEFLCLFCFLFQFLLALWYGSQCVQSTSNCPQKIPNPYTGGSVLTVCFGLLMPAVSLNQFTPTLKAIAEGKVAAARILSVIDRKSKIQSGVNKIKIQSMKGVFKFEGVTFAYPKDQTKKIFQNFNLEIRGHHSGIMGESGCGKSTLLQLMMRFYDPDEGVITLDGVNLKELDLQWLRQQIGYIGQEPLLFSTTIKENLLIGKSNATQEEIIQALRSAQLLEFVTELGEKVDTYVGSGGSQLSGGQKQRIAITRALLKNPFILLLDQATSALDRTNEKNIQQTLNKIFSQKKTVTVTHRLKTIANCDEVIRLQHGKVVEQGDLKELSVIDQLYLSPQKSISESAKRDTINNLSKRQIQKSAKKLQLKNLTSFSMIETQKQLAIQDINPHDGSATVIKQEEEVKEDVDVNVNERLFDYVKQSRLIFVIGIICAFINGMAVPTMGLHVARIVSFMLLYLRDPDHYRQQIRWSCLYMLITCIVGPLAAALQYSTFLSTGSRTVSKLRQDIYRKVIRLPLSWFQSKENHAQQISIRLGPDMHTINNIVSRYVAQLVAATSNIASGLILAFIFEWRTALISLGLIPLIGVVGVFQAKIISGYLNQSQGLYAQSAKILAQSITHIKTIISFCSEEETIVRYSQRLEDIVNQQHRKKVISTFMYGFTFFILYLTFGILFYVASIFISQNNLSITNSISAVFLVLFSGMIAGNNVQYLPDLSKLQPTAQKLFEMIDLQDEDEMQKRKGSKMLTKQVYGNLSFRNVCFKYENRDELALKNISFDVKQGENVALVGSSGCGKSTILKLLLGFYSLNSGQILIDGVSINDYNIHCLRQNFGTVSQEPSLFDETVQYNIVYNRQKTTKDQIYAASSKARLIPLISNSQNPEIVSFFQRKVGPRGSHISGGQKQRTAIARTLLRGPKVLLLDEATSALDKQNEEQVQQSLDQIMEGKTTLNVTHKLERLSNTSHIFVLDAGEVIEQGKYSQLIQIQGSFYRLLNGLQV